MKKHLQKLFILIPLIFIAGATFAAYDFTGPTAAPSANNTDGPLIDTSLDQTKAGGLSVNTFTAAKNAFFNQNATFTGTVFGGTPKTAGPVAFGNGTNKVNVAINGTQSITGIYQSDTLKTGGGLKPLCADANGTFYICGVTPTTPVNNSPQVTISYIQTNTANNCPVGDTGAGCGPTYSIGAHVSYPLSQDIEVYLTESSAKPSGGAVSMIDKIKNYFTADALAYGVCYPPSSPESFGSVQITAGLLNSWGTVPLPNGCTPSDILITISMVSPGVVDGKTLQYSTSSIPGIQN